MEAISEAKNQIQSVVFPLKPIFSDDPKGPTINEREKERERWNTKTSTKKISLKKTQTPQLYFNELFGCSYIYVESTGTE